MVKVELSVLVGRNIILRRKSLAISQKELARLLDITTDSMMKIEKGVIAPKMSRLQEIADVLQCSVASLFIDDSSGDIHDLALSLAENMKGLKDEDREYLVKQIDATLMFMKSKY